MLSYVADEGIYRSAVVVAGALSLVGCGSAQVVNPSFSVTRIEARALLDAMKEEPIALDRPVLVLSGIHDPGVAGPSVRRALRAVTTEGTPLLDVSFLTTWTFDSCRDRVLRRVDAAWGTNGEPYTGEIDVVAVSMGGLVARHAAIPRRDDGHHLRIRRLFTISSPHGGAKLAWLGFFDPRARDMQAGSPFLTRLDVFQREQPIDIVPYTRLADGIVGEESTAPLGGTPWWVATPRWEPSHGAAHRDPRLLADIAKRLRNEAPVTGPEPAPLPSSGADSESEGSGGDDSADENTEESADHATT